MKRLISLLIALVMTLTSVSALAYEELAKGSKGDAVVELQERLNELGYSVGTADGDYGSKTVHAIAEFQINNALSMTGVANVETLDILFSDDAKGKSMTMDKNQVLEEEFLNAAGLDVDCGTTNKNSEDYIYVNCNRDNSNELQVLFDVGIGTQSDLIIINNADSDTVAYFCTLMYKYSACFDMLVCEALRGGRDSTGCIYYKTSFSRLGSSGRETIYEESELIEFLFAFTELAEEYTPSPNLTIPFNFNSVIDTTEEKKASVVKIEYSEEECKALALTYMQEHIRPYLKNPESLQIVNVSGYKTETEYLFTISYTAMNSFGGYTPETYYCMVDYTTGEVTLGGII